VEPQIVGGVESLYCCYKGPHTKFWKRGTYFQNTLKGPHNFPVLNLDYIIFIYSLHMYTDEIYSVLFNQLLVAESSES
jgi:hypothetical protein